VADHSERLLYGRDPELQVLEQLTTSVGNGQAQVLVIHGEAGVGKTALMEYLAKSASECRVERAFGIQSEMELAFAGVHQLCVTMLDQAGELPDPQRGALETALGVSSGPAPDRFLVSLAVLNLLSAVAEARPVLGLIDDAQWMDRASKQVLTFVARRLLAESIGLVFAVRNPPDEFSGLPQREVGRLSDSDARALLSQVMPGRLDRGVQDRIVAETRGNPLAILELSHEFTVAELAGGFAAPEPGPLTKRIEESFGNRLQTLPPDTNRLLLAAAAEPVGDPTLLWRASKRMGIDPEAAAPAISAGLLEVGARVRFRHPLMRSAVYGAASVSDRQEVHRALADSIDAEVDPDLRVWHLAQAVSSYDEDVALDLEHSAQRAQARGGIAAAAAFLERSAELTRDPDHRSRRMLDAAQAMLHAGALEQAAGLLAVAEVGHLDELSRARINLLHAQIAFIQNRGGDAVPLLLAAGRQLEQLDVVLARDTYLDAIAAAIFAGRLAKGPGLREVGEAARHVGNPGMPRTADSLLDALVVRLTDGITAAAPMMKRVLETLCDDVLPDQEARRWLWLGSVIAADLWDDERWQIVAARHLTLAREVGELSELPPALDSRAHVHVMAGEVAMAASLYNEVSAVCEAIGSVGARAGPIFLGAWRGDNHQTRTLIEDMIREAVPRGQGAAVTVAHAFEAVLYNGLGKYEDALGAAEEAARYEIEFGAPEWGLVELVEAAVRCGQSERAAEAVERLSVTTRASGTDWALGVEARSRALLSEGDAAEELYREAIERLARTRIRTDLARAQLLFGEWLRREGRRVDAREQLRAAYEAFSEFGAGAFSERARRELVATGETARRRTVETTFELTTQEALVARLAGEGYTNPEIGAQLFLSPRTVEYHLHKVFTKMGVTSRRELRPALQQSQ
jgi:DNA-binding CsgD family transcriptional regulator